MPWINTSGEWEWIDDQPFAEPTEETPPPMVTCPCCYNYEQVREDQTCNARVFLREGNAPRLPNVCEDCQRYCDSCDETYAVQGGWHEDYCPNCYDNDSCGEDEEFYYPRLNRFFGIGPKFFGLEIECEVNSSQARGEKLRQLRSILGDYAALKEDGSLDYGIEIATQPASMKEHKVRLAKLFAKLPRGLSAWRRPSCGLHIHVSRSPLSDLTIAKTVCFVSANHNRRFIKLIAGRDSNSYCKIQPKKLGTAAKYNADRYEAINLQNINTIEFRLFKGTLRDVSVYKALEFTDALTNYAGCAARSIRDSQSRVKFCAFVEENKATWPNLCAFIQARWFGRETDLTKQIGFNASENNQETLDQTSEQ